MADSDIRHAIKSSIQKFTKTPLSDAASELLNTLGYQSDKKLLIQLGTAEKFKAEFDTKNIFNNEKALASDWKSIDLLFQITDEEIAGAISSQKGLFENKRVDNTIIQSYLFFALDLSGKSYTRTQLARITREINKLFPMPAMVIFRYGEALTIAIIARRINKKDESRDVLEKVTLIKEIDIQDPHRGHIEILADLSITELMHKQEFSNFVELQIAWEKTLDTSELNKKFYKDIASWYFWAIKKVTFPDGAGSDVGNRNATSVIRLITRLIFVWFIKEKGLVPEEFFDERRLKELLNYGDPKNSTYYKAILQNLFFATLNTEMGRNRKFRSENENGGRDGHYLISSLYRYKRFFKDPDFALELFSGIPFLNGGLFECLDKEMEMDGKQMVIRIDGFSDREDNPIIVPDELFFGKEHAIDLSEDYGDRRHSADKVCGLINIFNNYKFTIEENTPIEEEIALDPELLGKVFENLLAAYNPETGTTARKQTGSFYTPREIVNYMVDEALIAYLESKLEDLDDVQKRIRHLVAYNNEEPLFDDAEKLRVIAAIDTVKVLDPACGSGAFPMGFLHKLVYCLTKLDPENIHWQELQLEKAEKETGEAYQIGDREERRKRILDIEEAFESNASDYGRKLYLIENCIYGVDIQPIAVQISKLRFFISLVVDQQVHTEIENFGIRPLPNLESKFVSANTLVGIEKPQQMSIRNTLIDEKEKALAAVRNSLFTARKSITKRKFRDLDKQLRGAIATLLKNDGWRDDTATLLAGWDPFDQNLSAEFFDPEWMFGVTNGFDIVIGNPPYINAKEMQRTQLSLRHILKNSYQFLTDRWDIYIAFIEKAMTISSNKSVISLIIPNAFVRENYSKKLRDYLVTEKLIKRVVFYDYDIFEASVRNIVVIITKPYALEFTQVVYSNKETFHEKNVLIDDMFISADNSLQHLLENELTLDKIFFISKGMVLNADEKHASGEFIKDDLVSNIEDVIHCKRYTEGKWIDKYKITEVKFLEWGTDRVPAKISRKTFPELYEREKILTNKLGELKAIIDDTHIYCDQTIRVLVRYIDLHNVQNASITNSISRFSTLSRYELENISKRFRNKYILALLNSKLYCYLLGLLRTKESIDINPQILRKLPVIEVDQDKQAVFENLVNNILRQKNDAVSLEITKDEEKIDKLIYELFGLSDEEIAVVENNIITNSNVEDYGE